ncbi:MAG: hypothetical protein M1837_002207 [Sclerophora amabilis]|nr:MAG: hypothetical protein M1837_002207 [Sclerophora amabilis]
MLSCWAFPFLIAALAHIVDAEQIPIKLDRQNHGEWPTSQRIAIIGAGIAGASAAYRLGDSVRSELVVDIFEAESQVGGRVKSVPVYDGFYGSQHVETGSPVFYANDKCVQAAIDEVGLRQRLEPHYPRKQRVGVWNGQSFILRREKDLKSTTWRDFARSTWRYGLSPRRLLDLVKTRLPQYQRLAGAYETVTPNLPEALDNLGLTAAYAQSADHYLLNNSVSLEYAKEVVQATTRAWLGHDLNELNGLAALVAMNTAETDSIQSVIGGNQKLIERLLKLSGAHLHLNTRATKITRSDHGRYRLHVTSADHQDLPDGPSVADAAEYDAIIIATPLQGARLDLDLGRFHGATRNVPVYAERHVTHFTSPLSRRLDPSYFNVSTAHEIPDQIFTTTMGNAASEADPDFFRIDSSLAAAGMDGCVAQSENLYKITSATAVEDGMIATLLGHPPNSALEDLGVRWVHRQVWPHASPKFRRNNGAAMLDNIEIAPRVFYTGLSDEIVTSLEMSCRMGQLAANLLLYPRVPDSVSF